MIAISSGIEDWIPSDTPHGITSRTPPSSRESEIPLRCASMSQSAFSSVALAMGLPRTRRKIFGQSPPCSGVAAASIGPSSFTITCQQLSVDSAEKNGRSPAVHSPQPDNPSDRTSARTMRRLLVTPKLVSNGRTSGTCSSRRMIASIFIILVFPSERKIQMKLDQLQLGCVAQFIDSISFRIPDKADYGQSPGKSFKKLAPVLHLNGKRLLPARLGGLPIVDGRGNPNLFFKDQRTERATHKNALDVR